MATLLKNKKAFLILIGITFVIVALVFVFPSIPAQKSETETVITPTVAISNQTQNIDSFTYQGEEGKSAFEILEVKTKVEIDKVGLVSAINGRKADNSKREFWAFYVNGKLAEVGPKDYITKSTDKIEWKIETY